MEVCNASRRRRCGILRRRNFGACPREVIPLNKQTKKQLTALPPPLASPERERRENNATDGETPGAHATGSPGTRKRKATANRFGILNEFIDCSLAGLSKTELLVWFTLYRDTRNGTARTSQTDIARRGGVSKRAVQYATRRLEKRGLLRCVFRGGLNRGPSRWQVLPTGKKTDQPPKRQAKLRSSALTQKDVSH